MVRNTIRNLSRAWTSGSKPKWAASSRKSNRRPSQRRLRSEQLEGRRLLAGDVGFSQNFWEPTDVNGDAQVTAVDALIVINQLSRGGEGEITGFTDVNGDGVVTPVDALKVINHLIDGDSSPRIQSQLDRLQTAAASGDLPEGVSVDQVNDRIAALQTALETGIRPEGTRPEGVGRPTGMRPSSIKPAGSDTGGYSADRAAAQIERLQGDLPESVTDEQANARIEVLQTALETGVRPEGTRPEGVGRPTGVRPIFGRPGATTVDSEADQLQAREQFFANFAAGQSGRPSFSFGRPF